MGARKIKKKSISKKPAKKAAVRPSAKKRKSVKPVMETPRGATKKLNICNECGKLNALSYNFCEKCGGQVFEAECPLCPNCSCVNNPAAEKCAFCGEKIKGGRRNAAKAEPVKPPEAIEKEELLLRPGDIKLDGGAIISETIEAFGKNFFLFIVVGIIGSLMEVLGRIYILANPGAWPIIFFYLFGFFVSSFCSVMVFIALARLDKGEKAGLNNFWELFDLSTEKYLRFITTTIAYGLMVLVGTILLIIPGIIFSYKYRLALPMSVLDSKEGEDYLKKSGQMTEGFKFDIFVCLFLAGMALIPLYLAVLIIVCVVCLIFGIAIDKETFNTAVIFCYPLTKPYSIMILYYIYSKFLFRE